MEIKPVFSPLAEVSADWLIIPIWEEEPFADSVVQLDQKMGGQLARAKENQDIAGKTNEVTSFLNVPGLTADRLVVVGLGKKSKADLRTLINAAACAGKTVSTKARERAAMSIPDLFGNLTLERLAYGVGVGLAYGCEGPGLRKSKTERFPPGEIHIVGPALEDARPFQDGARKAQVLAGAVSACRDLVNTPPCDLYPESFAERAQEMARAYSLECTIFDERKLAEEQMGSLLGVAQGSDKPPRLVLLHYQGNPGGKTLGLVGKGVTFDSGGLSLKPSEGMLDMKCDMAGAAAVFGALQAIAELKLPVNVLGVLALVENMPSGKALKLGDVLRARNGKTIEIHNTDAEGRLILADALAYAVDQKVDHLVDLATLTGACIVALGTEVTGLMTNDETWSQSVQTSAGNAGELVWPLPMIPLYTEMIQSHVADIKNTGGTRWAGAITAAKLLEEFVDNIPWVHLDIAGPSWKESASPNSDPGGTGVMVRTLVELAQMYS